MDKQKPDTPYKMLSVYQLSLLPITLFIMLRPVELAFVQPIFTYQAELIETVGQVEQIWSIKWIVISVIIIAITLSLLLIIKQLIQLYRIQKNSSNTLHQIVDSIKDELAIKETVLLINNSYFNSIFSFVMVHPVIVIPDKFIQSLNEKELRYVLQHELVHIKFRDFYVNLLQQLVFLCYLYNPIIWLCNRQIDRFRELRCDDYVLSLNKTNSLEYAHILLKVYELSKTKNLSVVLPLINSQKEFKTRITKILNDQKVKPNRLKKLISISLGLGFLMILSCTDYSIKPVANNTSNLENVPAVAKNEMEMLPFYQVDKKPQILSRVSIVYPIEAKQAGIEANVVIELIINEYGDPTNLRILKGHPALNQAALDAISKYRFSPGEIDGKIVQVKWQIPIRFRISK